MERDAFVIIENQEEFTGTLIGPCFKRLTFTIMFKSGDDVKTRTFFH